MVNPYEPPAGDIVAPTSAEADPSQLNLRRVIRDALIVVAFTGVGGFIVGVIPKLASLGMAAIAISNLVTAISGFFLCCILAKKFILKHLVSVALLVWLIGAVNILAFSIPVANWLSSSLFILFAMLVGGGAAHLFLSVSAKLNGRAG